MQKPTTTEPDLFNDEHSRLHKKLMAESAIYRAASEWKLASLMTHLLLRESEREMEKATAPKAAEPDKSMTCAKCGKEIEFVSGLSWKCGCGEFDETPTKYPQNVTVECPHCGEPKTMEDETTFFYKCGSTFNCVERVLRTNEKCRESAKTKPTTGTLRELVERWRMEAVVESLDTGTRETLRECAAELSAALNALEPSEDEIEAAYREECKVVGIQAFTFAVRWMLARIKGVKNAGV